MSHLSLNGQPVFESLNTGNGLVVKDAGLLLPAGRLLRLLDPEYKTTRLFQTYFEGEKRLSDIRTNTVLRNSLAAVGLLRPNDKEMAQVWRYTMEFLKNRIRGAGWNETMYVPHGRFASSQTPQPFR